MRLEGRFSLDADVLKMESLFDAKQFKNQKMFELIRIFREKISTFDTSKHRKNGNKAAELRSKGNDLFSKGLYEDAIQVYTEASIFAPLEESEEFSLSVANRSACFFHLNKYKDCLHDIELAISYGYPAKSRIKLIARKATCENELKKLITNAHEISTAPTPSSSTESSASKDIEVSRSNEMTTKAQLESLPTTSDPKTGDSQNIDKSPLLSTISVLESTTQEVNEPAKEMSSNGLFSVSTSETRGKCLIANQTICAGSLILNEKAFLSVLHPSNFDKYCYHCLKKLSPKSCYIFPCKTCTQVRFCSSTCSSQSQEEYHWLECGFLDLLTISKDFHYSPKITLRVFAKYGISKCLSAVPLDSRDDSVIPEGYEGFLDMIEHEREDENDYSIASAIITGLLLEKNSSDIMMTKASMTSLMERVGKHLRQVNVNAITILSKDVTRNDDAEAVYTESTVGVGLFLTTRLINHSCHPNARIVRFDQDTLYLMSVRDILSGEEISISYGGSYRWQIRSKRRKMLRDSYFFDCQCIACKEGMQPLTTALLCPDCRGPVISDGPMICLDCKKRDHMDVSSVIVDTTACLKIIQLADTVMDPKNKDAAATSGINPFEVAEKSLDEAFNTLGKIVYKTHLELFKIQEKKLVCCLKLKKYRRAVDVAQFLVDNLRLQYHETYFKVFNSLLTLLKCQSLYYKQLKASSPLDKNEINVLKTAALKNVDLLEVTFDKISSGDDSVIRERILSMKRLFCPN